MDKKSNYTQWVIFLSVLIILIAEIIVPRYRVLTFIIYPEPPYVKIYFLQGKCLSVRVSKSNIKAVGFDHIPKKYSFMIGTPAWGDISTNHHGVYTANLQNIAQSEIKIFLSDGSRILYTIRGSPHTDTVIRLYDPSGKQTETHGAPYRFRWSYTLAGLILLVTRSIAVALILLCVTHLL